MKVSLVVVAHRSQEELPGCISSFRREASALGAEPEVVVVEHSEDPACAEAARSSGADVTLVRPNRGYAAGLNAGVASATGEVLLLGNPDVELLPGGLGRLLDGLRAGFAVTAPQQVWDRQGRLLLPVPDDPAPRAEALRLARRAWQWLWRLGLGADLERTSRLWSAVGPRQVPCLRGPLLALERATWDALGPLDEGYFLYYEETEWLWRASRSGARLALVGDARIVHRFGHATRLRLDRGAIEERSRRRFFERNYSPLARRLVGWLERRPQGSGPAVVPLAGPEEVPAVEADLWLLSPFRHLQPAAGWVGDTVPDELGRLTREGAWVTAAARRVGGRWRLCGCWAWGASA